ncbi:MAG TPA: hybrid sensor histidine kinase/response regulator [Trichocoleus sp.]|jgi:signal transduction histidine kinase
MITIDRSIHILLVEDSPTDANLMHQIFLRSGRANWELAHVERLTDAIEACHAHRFDAVLLDLHLPDSDGLETIVEFKTAAPEIPVVVLTMRDDEELALQTLAIGAQDYLVKDQITIHLLVRSIRYAVERGEILNQLKASERRVAAALEQEQAISQLKSSFLSIASHQFRTPLTIIRTSAELLFRFDPNLSGEQRDKYFSRIRMAIDQMTNLIDEILLLGSAEAGGLQFHPTSLNLREFCTELVDTMQQTIGCHHRLLVADQGDCFDVVADPDLLRHILSNLLSNAIKYSPLGKEVRLGLARDDATVTFQVHDEGIGIPPQDLPYLFEAFHRCSNVGKISGSGLGLAIVKKCVHLHGGQITVVSEPKLGTTFTVTLPLDA